MTNKTITLSRELLDAAAVAVGEWGDSLLSRCNPGHGTAMLDLERELRDVLNADPVPPAGGEPEVIARFIENCGEGGGVVPNREGDLCEYRHVTRLQAEVERLKQVAIDRKDELTKLCTERNDLQSELTKARELISGLRADTQSGYLQAVQALQNWANQSAPAEESYPPCDYCGTVPDYHPWHGSGLINGEESPHIHACNECRAKLPAPADKGQGEPVAWANWKVGTKSYVPFRSQEEAIRSVDNSEIAATQQGPYRVVALYAAQSAPVAVVQRQDEKLMEIVERYPNGDPLEYDAALRQIKQ